MSGIVGRRGLLLGGEVIPPVFVPTMLDPMNKGTGVVLSNLNLTATKGSGGTGFRMARSVKGVTTGKYKFSVTWDEFSGSFVGVGLGDQDASVNSFFGADTHGMTLIQNGEVYAGGPGGLPVTTIQTSAETNVTDCEFHVDAALAWFRTNGGYWNNNPSADPATGVGGIPFPAGMSGTIYAGVMVQTSPTDQMSINFGPTFPYPTSAGFDMIGEYGPPSILGLSGVTDTL